MKYFSVAALVLFLFSPASAEDCRKYPPGPFRFECASAKNPGLIAKRERCKQLATERGFKFGVQNKPVVRYTASRNNLCRTTRCFAVGRGMDGKESGS
jgi:hypothetical protein